MARYYAQLDDAELEFDIREGEELVVRPVGGGDGEATHQIDFAPVHASPVTGEGLYSLLLDGTSYQLYVSRPENAYRVAVWRHRFDVEVLSEREWRLHKVAPKQASQGGRQVISAPMPGLVKQVPIAEGDEVKSGQRLVVLEAMKMENDINSPRDGRVAVVHVQAGAIVESGRPLVTLE